MNDIDKFRNELRERLSSKRGEQAKLVRETGVPQYAISRFLSGKDLPGRQLLPLYLHFSEKQNSVAEPSVQRQGG